MQRTQASLPQTEQLATSFETSILFEMEDCRY